MASGKKKKSKGKKKDAPAEFSLFDYLFSKYGPVMRTADVAEVLHCHPSHVRALCKKGELPAVRIGDRWVIPVHKMVDLLDGEDDAYVG